MSTTDFTAPIYHDHAEEETAHDEPAAHEEADGSEVVDLNDPSLLLQELEGYDLAADPYAQPAPPPDGFYRAKLKQIDVKNDKGEAVRVAQHQEMNYPGGGAPGVPVFLPSGKPKTYVQTAVEATIIDPGGKYDNIKVYDRFFDSRINRDGGVKMLHLLKVLNRMPTPADLAARKATKLNQVIVSEFVLKALAGEPEVDIQTQWEGQASQDDVAVIKGKGGKAPRVRGMNRFPQDPSTPGKYLPDMMQEVAKAGKFNVHAQAQLAGIFPVGTKTKKK
jgi:hypothetical protein